MMQAVADYVRLLRAVTTLIRYDVVLPDHYHARLPVMARVAGRIFRIFRGKASGRAGERLTRALERLGPAYIKLGQFLATRPDIFGVDVTTDLSRLKDKLPAFGMQAACDALDAEFGKGAREGYFTHMSEPVAAASLAQVHRLDTPQGAKAVKILRPGIEHVIECELRAMKRAAHTVEHVSTASRRFRPVAFIATVAESMRRELDMRFEAGGADVLREIALKTGYFQIPAVDWARTSQRVLTTDWVAGKPLTDPSALDCPGIDRQALANSVTSGFLSCAMEYGVFHADMHEGNIIITPGGDLALVDFGLIGRIGMKERHFLVETLWGFINRDYQRAADIHFKVGYVPSGQSAAAFAQALRAIGEPIHGKAASDISMGHLLLQLIDFTRIFGMQMRPELVLLQKTMVQVEGVARGIDPDHDIWAAAEPVIKAWITRNLGAAGAGKQIRHTLRQFADRLAALPEHMPPPMAAPDMPPAMPLAKQPPVRAQGNWPGWVALFLSGIALVLVLTG